MSNLKIMVDTPPSLSYIPPELTGEQMRTIREVNGLRQVEIASALGISQAYLAQMETGVRKISRRTAIAFCSVVNAHKDRTRRRSKTA